MRKRTLEFSKRNYRKNIKSRFRI